MTRKTTVSELDATELGESARSDLARAETDAPAAINTRGNTINRFVVLETLGVGGMGVVYAAYDPNLDRKVALKLLSTPVAASDEARIRMLREAQAMARIDHPNVLRVYEAGEFGSQIYIAMEFASGGTLRSWGTVANRRPREILDVYTQAGHGLAAAHAAGLVHRDFKPDNVMMLGDGRVRVTDFGLVGTIGDGPMPPPTQLDGPITDITPLSQDLTRTGALMGTPSYMAPEQFRGLHVGPAADQFAFCVALYEALYKQKPFAGLTFSELCANVISGEIRQVPRDAHVPSRIEKAVLRGLSVEPADRFPSMDALLAKLERSPWRRAWIATGIAGAAVAGAATFVMLRPPTEACSGADGRLATTWNPTHAAMLGEAFASAPRPDAIAVVGRVISIFDRWGSSWEHAYIGACEDTRVRAIQSEHLLDLRMECLTRGLADAHATLDALEAGGGDAVDHAFDVANTLPDLSTCANTAALTAAVAPPSAVTRYAVAAVRDKLTRARAQSKLAHYPAARELAAGALTDARKIGYPPAIAEALLELGTNESKLAERDASVTLADAMRTAIAAGATDTALLATARRIKALMEKPEAFPVADELAKIGAALAEHASPPPETAVELDNARADLLAAEGSLDASQHLYEQSLALATKQLGADDDHAIESISRLAMLSIRRHHFEEARGALQRVADAKRRTYGDDHPEYARALDNLANIDAELGQPRKSLDVRQRALAIRIAALGPEHPDVGTSYTNLGAVYNKAGDLATAKTYFEKALAILSKVYGDDSVRLEQPLVDLGNTLASQGDRARARTLIQRALANGEKAYPTDDPRLAITLDNLGMVERDDAHYDDALALFQRAERITEKAFGTKDPHAAAYLGEIAATYRVMNKMPEAREAMNRTVAAIAASYGPSSPQMATTLANVGLLDMKVNDYAGALDNFQQARAIFEDKLGKDHPSVALCLEGTGQALVRLKREGEAVAVLERALAITSGKQFPPSQVAEMHFYLGDALYKNPATRVRARSEITVALGLYEKANNTSGCRDNEDLAPQALTARRHATKKVLEHELLLEADGRPLVGVKVRGAQRVRRTVSERARVVRRDRDVARWCDLERELEARDVLVVAHAAQLDCAMDARARERVAHIVGRRRGS